MNNPIKQQLAADLGKVKAQSGDRLQRIQEILKAAFSEAVSEVKAGGQEVKATSKASLRNVVQTVSNQEPAEAVVTVAASDATLAGESADGVVSDAVATERAIAEAKTLGSDAPTAMPETSTLKILEDLFKATGLKAKSMAQEQYGKLETELPGRAKQLQSKAQDWDEQLAQRYGDDYAGLKQRLTKALAWYQEKLSAGKSLKAQPVEKKEAKEAEEFGDLGVKVAQKEAAIKQQIGQTLRTITVNVRS